MVELTLVGWKDPVVLDLPTTDWELEPAIHHPRCHHRNKDYISCCWNVGFFYKPSHQFRPGCYKRSGPGGRLRVLLLGVWVTAGAAVRRLNWPFPPHRFCSLRTPEALQGHKKFAIPVRKNHRTSHTHTERDTSPEIRNPHFFPPTCLLPQMCDVPSGSSWPRRSHWRYEPETFDQWATTHSSIHRPLSTELTMIRRPDQ